MALIDRVPSLTLQIETSQNFSMENPSQIPPEFEYEVGRIVDAVEPGRSLCVGICAGTILFRIEGGRPQFRDTFILHAELVEVLEVNIHDARSLLTKIVSA